MHRAAATQGVFDFPAFGLVGDENNVGYPQMEAECPNGTIFIHSAATTRISCGRCISQSIL